MANEPELLPQEVLNPILRDRPDPEGCKRALWLSAEPGHHVPMVAEPTEQGSATGPAHSLVGRTPPPVPLQMRCSDGKRLRLITGARIEVRRFTPKASPQDLQIDPEHPVCFDRSPIPGRKPKPVLERRCANQRVIDGTPGDTSPGKTGEELLGRCSAKEAGRWEVPGQQSLGRLRRAPEGWWQPGDHREGFECSMPSESDAAIGDRICGRPGDARDPLRQGRPPHSYRPGGQACHL